MAPRDRFALNAANRSDVDPNGFFDVIAHGNSSKTQVQTADGPVLVNHRVAARLISQSPDYNGQPIRLLSCSTGSTKAGMAQNLSNAMGVEVHAPDNLLWAYPNGRMIVAPSSVGGGPDLGSPGNFRVFLPGNK
jgi:hypothetical protein